MASTALGRLRRVLRDRNLTAFIIPTDDAHLSEYPAACDARREYVSGFTGSAGTAVVTADQALLWTDGRYWLQAARQLSDDWTVVKDRLPETPSIPCWLVSNLSADAKVGIDATTISYDEGHELQEQLTEAGMQLVLVDSNPVDEAWGDERPGQPDAPVRVHPAKFAGYSAAHKLSDVRTAMAEAGATAAVITALDEVAWLLNIRGGDISHNPITIAYVIVTSTDATLYIEATKLSTEVTQYLTASEDGPRVKIVPYIGMLHSLGELAAKPGERVWIDPASSSFAVAAAVPEHARLFQRSPVSVPKAIKNEAEIEGMKAAHVRDGVALAKFFAWLHAAVGEAAKQAKETLASAGGDPADVYAATSSALGLTEYTIGEKLAAFRAEQAGFVSLSFDTIAGSGPNGAVIHYRAEELTARPVSAQELLLLDSGGQYEDGTTDVTRCFHFGTPTEDETRAYTRVLQAHIAMDTAIFPEGTPGSAIDALVRAPLWADGYNFMHGTGHGVGAALNVHEGPQGISSRPNKYKGGLKLGMIVTDEPGYYEDNSFGIRIENVCVIRQAETRRGFGDKPYCCFEYITAAPIATNLVQPDLLLPHEIAWLDSYNAWVLRTLSPHLQDDAATLEWLRAACAPLQADAAAGSKRPR